MKYSPFRLLFYLFVDDLLRSCLGTVFQDHEGHLAPLYAIHFDVDLHEKCTSQWRYE